MLHTLLQPINLAAEAKSERLVNRVAEPDEGTLARTLLRLRHDLGTEGGEFLRKTATALALRRDPPPLDAMESALNACIAEVVAMRNEGLTRALSIDDAERFFAMAFGLEQLFRDFRDLDRCVREHARLFAGERPR